MSGLGRGMRQRKARAGTGPGAPVSRLARRHRRSQAISAGRDKKRGWEYSDLVKLFVVLLLIPLSFAMDSVPTGYVAEGPGPSFDIQGTLRVEGAAVYPSSGEIMLTAVSLRESVLAYHLASLFGMYSLLKVRHYLGEDLDAAGQETMEELITLLSQNTAVVVALRRAGVEVETRGLGVMVVSTAKGYPAFGLLRAGELITAVNGTAVEDAEELGRLMDEVPEGEEAVLEVREVDREALWEHRRAEDIVDPAALLSPDAREVRLRPVWDAGLGRRVVGVVVRDCFAFSSSVEVNWELNSVRGPSAGLAMALSLVNALSPEDITGGRKVAATGEIFLSGEVGPVGGLVMKVRAAESQGAEVFIYPRPNQEDLRGVRADLLLIPVDTLEEALEALRDLGTSP